MDDAKPRRHVDGPRVVFLLLMTIGAAGYSFLLYTVPPDLRALCILATAVVIVALLIARGHRRQIEYQTQLIGKPDPSIAYTYMREQEGRGAEVVVHPVFINQNQRSGRYMLR
jgi:hypothetical protein